MGRRVCKGVTGVLITRRISSTLGRALNTRTKKVSGGAVAAWRAVERGHGKARASS